MKYTDAELIKSTKRLYNDIDSCITNLLNARIPGKKDEDSEGKALFHMEGLMVATLQQLDCIIDSLQQEQESVAERFARIVRGNLIGIDKEVQQKFENLYFEITGNKMYGGYND
jgi:hypothetical protein